MMEITKVTSIIIDYRTMGRTISVYYATVVNLESEHWILKANLNLRLCIH